MNAMAHAVETLYGPDLDPVTASLAEEAIRRLGASLPEIVRDPRSTSARTDALYGAWLAGAFRTTPGLEHALAQRVRQWFGLDHARTHAVMLPYAVAFNRAHAPAAMGRIERALGVGDAAQGLYQMNVRLRAVDRAQGSRHAQGGHPQGGRAGGGGRVPQSAAGHDRRSPRPHHGGLSRASRRGREHAGCARSTASSPGLARRSRSGRHCAVPQRDARVEPAHDG